MAEDPRLAQIMAICLGLPEVSHAAFGVHVRFLVRAKAFAYFLNDHHGDGRIGIACKAARGINEMLAETDPTRFYLPAYLAHQGWMGLRLDVGAVDWDEVTAFLHDAYRLAAPKRLAASIEPAFPSEPTL